VASNFPPSETGAIKKNLEAHEGLKVFEGWAHERPDEPLRVVGGQAVEGATIDFGKPGGLLDRPMLNLTGKGTELIVTSLAKKRKNKTIEGKLENPASEKRKGGGTIR